MRDEYDFSDGVRGKYAGKTSGVIHRTAPIPEPETLSTDDLTRLADGSSVFYSSDGQQQERISMARELLKLRAAQAQTAANDGRVDAIMSALYRRFQDWNRRNFSADDVTWCEVKADVERLIAEQYGAELAALRQKLQELESGMETCHICRGLRKKPKSLVRL